MAADLPVAGANWSAYLPPARHLSEVSSAATETVGQAATSVLLNHRARRDRPAVARLQAAVKTLSLVERSARGIARALADTPTGWCLPPPVAGPLADLLRQVAAELDQWAASMTSTGPPDADSPPVSSVPQLYHAVLVAARSHEISPETAAVASSIAVDAYRIHEELQSEPELPATPNPLSWQSLFGP